MVRGFFFAFAILFSVSHHAMAQDCGRIGSKTLKQVCDRQRTYEGTFACMAAGKDRYLDSCALSACDRFTTENGTTRCVQAIADQVYTLDEVAECDRYTNENLSIQCFAASGTSYVVYQRIQIAGRSGRKDGQRAAERIDVSSADGDGITDGSAAGLAKAKNDAATNSFREGYRTARARAAATPAAYADGRKEGNKIAKANAEAIDFALGYQAEKSTALTVIPPRSVEIDLSDDKTVATRDGAGNDVELLTPKVDESAKAPEFTISENVALAPPVFAGTPPKLPGTQANYSDYDAPCLPSDSKCISAYKNGYVAAYADTIRRSYKTAYAASYNRRAAEQYDANSKADDVKERERGTTQGALHQGILDAYAKEYPGYATALSQEGHVRFGADLQNGFLVVLRTARFVSSSIDALVPGSKFSVVVEVDNLGEVDAPAGYFRLANGNSKIGQWTTETRVLPSIPAKSRVTFTAALLGTAATFAAGSKTPFEIVLQTLGTDDRGADKFFARQSLQLEAQAHFPVELVKIEPETPFSGGRAVAANFTLRNALDQPSQEFKAFFDTEPRGVNVADGNGVTIPSLKPGEEHIVRLTLSPTIWTSAGATEFTVDLSTNGQHVSKQKFGHVVDMGYPVKLFAYSGGNDVTNRTSDVVGRNGGYGGVASVNLVVKCDRKIEHGEGYSLQYGGSSVPGVDFVGTVGADLGRCEPGRTQQIASGTVWASKSAAGNTASLKFYLKQGGATLQGVQVFIRVK